MSEYVLRFILGGLIVTAFSTLGDVLRPKSFAGLFGAAPSVALATLGIAIAEHGASYAAIEAQTMMLGAVALALYSIAVCQLLIRTHLSALPTTLLAMGIWFAVAFGLYALMPGAA